MKLLFALSLLLATFCVNAQKEIIKDCRSATVPPETWKPYLTKTLQQTVENAAYKGIKNGSYKVEVTFIVDKDGIPNFKSATQKNKNYNFIKACKQTINNGPTWPIIKDAKGKPIKSLQKTNIMFVINEE